MLTITFREYVFQIYCYSSLTVSVFSAHLSCLPTIVPHNLWCKLLYSYLTYTHKHFFHFFTSLFCFIIYYFIKTNNHIFAINNLTLSFSLITTTKTTFFPSSNMIHKPSDFALFFLRSYNSVLLLLA
jgi:hypothetical protein